MCCVRQFSHLVSGRGFTQVLTVAVLGCAEWLYAQNFTNAATRNLPADPPLFSSGGRNAALLDAFQSGASSDRFSGRGDFRFGRIAGWKTQDELPSLFEQPNSASHNLKFVLQNSRSGSLQSFDPLRPGVPDLRWKASIDSTRLSYREVFRPRDPFTNGGFGFGSATSNSSNSGFANGALSFSATTTYAGRPVTGSVRAGKNSIAPVPGGQKHSGPSLALKLSF